MEIQQTDNKPYINLDELNCILTIKGASYGEHVDMFYEPIFAQVNEHIPTNDITINLAMSLMDSVSEKYIFHIIKTLTGIHELVINWYYEEDDEDMLDTGEIWRDSLTGTEFNIYSVLDINDLVI
jgi:hypothetical protein